MINSSYRLVLHVRRYHGYKNSVNFICRRLKSSLSVSRKEDLDDISNINVDDRPRLQKLRERLKAEESSGVYSVERNQSFLKQIPNHSESIIEKNSNKRDSDKGGNIESLRLLIEELKEEERKRQDNSISKSNMLIDRYNRHHNYLRISLSERCNLRCLYCMPPEGVPLQPDQSLLSAHEIQHIVDMFVASGVNKIRLTGGEPLLRNDLVDIIADIAKHKPMVKSIGITTNGITLSRHIRELVEAGMTHANISLDTLNVGKFEEITRRRGLKKVLRAIDDAHQYLCSTENGYGRLKINCVVMKGFNDMELKDFVMYFTKDRSIDMRFIEWMPFNDNGWNANRFVSYQDMLNKFEDDDNISLIRDRPSESKNDTTKWYRIPGHKGRVGFITSMSEHFCGTCNRLRITADGQLKVCLFGNQEISLRDALRAGFNENDIQLLIGAAVRKKNFALGGHGDMYGIREANDNRPMTLIGG